MTKVEQIAAQDEALLPCALDGSIPNEQVSGNVPKLLRQRRHLLTVVKALVEALREHQADLCCCSRKLGTQEFWTCKTCEALALYDAPSEESTAKETDFDATGKGVRHD